MLTQEEKFEIAWRNFRSGTWEKTINVRDFIQRNYQPYSGDDSFLAGATDRTKKLWEALKPLLKEEVEKGVLGVSQIPSTVAAHAPGYIDKALEIIVGLQTDEPLKRAIMPKGGWRTVEDSLKAYGYEPDQKIAEIFTKYAKTHNDGVFDAYTEQVRKCRKSGIITGLPDAYGRGRIIGDYRRLPLYGLDFLIQQKIKEKQEIDTRWSTEDILRLREELSSQIRSLKELKTMAESYGFDVSHPATNAREAVQWLYFAFLAAVKEQNGAAMSVGRISTFLDIYIERDLEEGTLTESQAQELIDDLVIKFRIVRFLRTPSYNQLFSGDPTWVTESIGGMGQDGRTIVTKNSFRMLNTLYTLGPAPEPNLTVLWSTRLPQGFKDFVAKVSIDTSSIQYMNDDLMRPKYGDDAGIACCVSAMAIGKQMQFFGARVNLLKTLLYSLNGGKDEISGAQIGPIIQEIEGDYLDYTEVMKRFEVLMDWLARTYVDALNIIHYMHDKYCYESILMAFHDRDILRTMAFGLAGLSHTADSLSAIKYAKVKAIRNEAGLIVDFKVEGEFPRYGNNDERADDIAVMLCSKMMEKIRNYPTYRNATHTQSILTITSNVVYGKQTGNSPDGRRAGEPFAPGANPSNGADKYGALPAMLSVAKLPYDDCEDGISLTISMIPNSLGPEEEKTEKVVGALDAFMASNGFHANLNVLTKETLQDAIDHPEKYPQLTIRVSGYAVNFVKLTKEQQVDVLNRTFHGSI
ncbi:formate C-acetyltransferase [Mongoliitalea lutea]|uniref:Formate acetyltransferase n=1 Tax=Mongoliitalea lutea TaxID=849756 RepID=A0A8J3CYY4_9BACT|nr:formate C-acetyltransferase [Mongoliitalea lutea]GHB36623.1 formate acetyltransferase [Mongoliitalea lutea]